MLFEMFWKERFKNIFFSIINFIMINETKMLLEKIINSTLFQNFHFVMINVITSALESLKYWKVDSVKVFLK